MAERSRIWILALMLALAPGAVVSSGCATKTTTVTTEKVRDDGGKETTVTTTTEEEVDRPTGVLSTAFNLVGEVIALPFRLVAGIVRLIF